MQRASYDFKILILCDQDFFLSHLCLFFTSCVHSFCHKEKKEFLHVSLFRKLVQDLLDSETDYVCDLRDLIENYFDVADDEFPDKKKGREIFRNVESLYQFHHR